MRRILWQNLAPLKISYGSDRMKGKHKRISFGLVPVLCLFGVVGMFAQAKPGAAEDD
jgi:hypothetical protein